jgi:hypothetical protein
MKALKNFSIVLVLVFSTLQLFSQELETVMESTWKGGMVSRDSDIDGGYFICETKIYNVNMISETSFTATASRSLSIDGKSYFCESNVSGSINTSNYTITLTHKEKYLYCQELPYGIDWHTGKETLTLYKDEEHLGYYLMYGSSAGQLFDDEFVMYSNY